MSDLSNNRDARYITAGRALGEARIRNRPTRKGGCGCPIIVEGRNDRLALESLGFTGEFEQVNRGWNQSRFIAYIFEKYGILNKVDQGPSVILLMDWDRTGGKLQSNLRRRLESFDVMIDEELRNVLMRALKPETRVVESLSGLAEVLIPHMGLDDHSERV